MNLTERRSVFVYDAARLAAVAAGAPVIPVIWADREQAFKEQFREVIERQCGEMRSKSPEELHGSWMQAYITMGWVYGEKYDREKKVHPDLVPYADLGQLERDKDAVFVALCEIARRWIYEKDRTKTKDSLHRPGTRLQHHHKCKPGACYPGCVCADENSPIPAEESKGGPVEKELHAAEAKVVQLGGSLDMSEIREELAALCHDQMNIHKPCDEEISLLNTVISTLRKRISDLDSECQRLAELGSPSRLEWELLKDEWRDAVNGESVLMEEVARLKDEKEALDSLLTSQKRERQIREDEVFSLRGRWEALKVRVEECRPRDVDGHFTQAAILAIIEELEKGK